MFKSEDLSLTFYKKASPPQRGRGLRGGGSKFIPNLFAHPPPSPSPLERGRGYILEISNIFG
jgi:hypothetical protein